MRYLHSQPRLHTRGDRLVCRNMLWYVYAISFF